jgi:hypothetical protein
MLIANLTLCSYLHFINSVNFLLSSVITAATTSLLLTSTVKFPNKGSFSFLLYPLHKLIAPATLAKLHRNINPDILINS